MAPRYRVILSYDKKCVFIKVTFLYIRYVIEKINFAHVCGHLKHCNYSSPQNNN